jgi:hypothetical protein
MELEQRPFTSMMEMNNMKTVYIDGVKHLVSSPEDLMKEIREVVVLTGKWTLGCFGMHLFEVYNDSEKVNMQDIRDNFDDIKSLEIRAFHKFTVGDE